MEQVVIDGIDIPITQNITSISLSHPYSIERTVTGIRWNGGLSLMVGDNILRSRAIQRVIQDNSTLSFEELDIVSQEIYTEDYQELTIVEATQAEIVAITGKLIKGLVDGGFGLAVDDMTALTTAVQSALTV